LPHRSPTMEIIKLRLVFDSKEEVFRDVEMNNEGSLEDLHEAILASFGMKNNQMASFYVSDDQWNKGDEYVLMNMGEGAVLMKEGSLVEFTEIGDRLLYVYDFMNLKIFYVEVIAHPDSVKSREYPYLLMAIGNMPQEEDELSYEGLMDGIEEEIGDHEGRFSDSEEEEDEWNDDSFENLDDYEDYI
jgi:hypothetical protein